MKYRIILEGFETKEDLLAWAEWFINSDEEFFMFDDGSFPAAVNAYTNANLEVVDNSLTIVIEKFKEP